jgi:hypothetical protein
VRIEFDPPTFATGFERESGVDAVRVVVATGLTSSGVAPAVVKYARDETTPGEEVETLPEPPLPPVAEMVTGEAPMTVKGVQDAEPEHDAVVVETLPKRAGVALLDVQ